MLTVTLGYSLAPDWQDSSPLELQCLQFHCMSLCVPCVCSYSGRSEEDIRSPGTEVTDLWAVQCRCWEANPCSLQEQLSALKHWTISSKSHIFWAVNSLHIANLLLWEDLIAYLLLTLNSKFSWRWFNVYWVSPGCNKDNIYSTYTHSSDVILHLLPR